MINLFIFAKDPNLWLAVRTKIVCKGKERKREGNHAIPTQQHSVNNTYKEEDEGEEETGFGPGEIFLPLFWLIYPRWVSCFLLDPVLSDYIYVPSTIDLKERFKSHEVEENQEMKNDITKRLFKGLCWHH